MGKIKSAVITTLLVLAIVVLALFAAISCDVPGSNGVDRYNSFLSSIHLGGSLSGEASTVYYPEGVISADKYNAGLPDDEDKREEYVKRYQPLGRVYIDTDKVEYSEEELKASVKKDAEVLSARFDKKGYSSYSVSVQDDYSIKVSVPTNFTYSQYKNYDSSSRTAQTNKIESTFAFLAYGGELSLRNPDVGNSMYNDIVTSVNDDVTEYFTGVSKFASGDSYAVRLDFTKEGKRVFADVTEKVAASTSDKNLYFYVGDDTLIKLNCEEKIDQSTVLITVSGTSDDEQTAENYAVVLNSVINGKVLELSYDTAGAEIFYGSAALGDYAALTTLISLLVIFVAAAVFSVVRYKKLGLVTALMIAVYALTVIIALLLIEIQLTVAGAVTIALGLALTVGSQYCSFEAVRAETKKGKTLPASVKSGYKQKLTTVLELHVILIVAALLTALVGKGSLAACGLIFFISVVASYVLYWFTRFMWFVISSPVKDKFKFCGFTREVSYDD